MLCHPQEIQSKPEYVKFREDYKKYRTAKCSPKERYYLRKELIQKYAKYGIFLTPQKCGPSCPYKEICNKHDNLWGKY